MHQKKLTFNRVLEVLHYDPYTGSIWRIGGRTRTLKPDREGYLHLTIDGQRYIGHVLAWFYMTGEWPATMIDHKDGNPGNNAWNNLRLATNAQNQANRHVNRDRKRELPKGVDLLRGKYIARIGFKKKLKYLGQFDTPEAAHSAYCAAARRYFGEFARAA